jgi:hypothetical protein
MEKAQQWRREGTLHHLIALFCTVAGKLSDASAAKPDFCNEIKDLERLWYVATRQKPF